MPRTRSHASVGAVVGALVVLMTACTGTNVNTNTGSPTSSTAAPATTAPATTSTTQDKKADEKIAKKSVLAVDDLPGSGWEEGKDRTKSDSDNNFDDVCPDLADDLKAFQSIVDDAPEARSPQLNQGRSVNVTSDVSIIATVDDATTLANVIGSQAFEECLPKVFEKSLDESASSGKVTFSNLSVERFRTGELGDDHGVFKLHVDAKSSSGSGSVEAMFAFIRVDRGYANLGYTVLDSEIDYAKDVKPIFEAATEKLRENLAS